MTEIYSTFAFSRIGSPVIGNIFQEFGEINAMVRFSDYHEFANLSEYQFVNSHLL
jgi:hypothetical protein